MIYTHLHLQDGTILVATTTKLYETGSNMTVQAKFNRFSADVPTTDLMGATYGETTYQVERVINSRHVDCCQVVDLRLVKTGCL